MPDPTVVSDPMTSEPGPEPGIAAAAEAIASEADESASKPDSAVGKLPSALTSLLSARVAIISAESQHATAILSVKLLWAIIAGVCSIIALLFVVAGLTGLLSDATGLAWFHAAFIMGGVFLLVVLFAVFRIRRKTSPIFPITRSEFEKDRTWLTSIKTKSISKS